MMASLSSSSELTLQCKTPSQSHDMLVMKPLVDHNHHSADQLTFQKLQEYLHHLEEERLKVDAFKSELPLCMHLLTHEMETLRQHLQSYNKENQGTEPVLEQFMPLKVSSDSGESDQKSENMSEKANWMTSAQLWSQSSDGKRQQSTTLPKAETDVGYSNLSPKLEFDTKQRNGGAFLPFRNDRNSSQSNSSPTLLPVPDLALASSDMEMEGKKHKNENGNGINGSRYETPNKGGNGVTEKGADTTTTITQTQRKARRCWSPELHRRFVNALQMLGGSQVATPKQIRELMKVDGLTNDEVKSHLQKYRLHTRRPGPGPPAAGAPAPQLVVLGGIWVPPEYTTGTAPVHGGAPAIYGATHPTSQVSPQYCSPTVPHDFYSPLPPLLLPPQAHNQLHHPTLHRHHQVHVYNTSSHTQVYSSPESDAQGVGDRSESIEDGKSENSSGKSSGENDRDGKKSVALQDDGGESNGSAIIIKF